MDVVLEKVDTREPGRARLQTRDSTAIRTQLVSRFQNRGRGLGVRFYLIPGNIEAEGGSPSSTFGDVNPIMDMREARDVARVGVRHDVEMAKQTSLSAADFIDTPACELPVLPSKRRVQKMLGDRISFVEPTFVPTSRAATRATHRRVRRSLECVDTLELDSLLNQQREIG